MWDEIGELIRTCTWGEHAQKLYTDRVRNPGTPREMTAITYNKL